MLQQFLLKLMVLAAAIALAGCSADTPAPAQPASDPGTTMKSGSGDQADSDGLVYPPARRSDHVDDYFGTEVADPYRWMEDLDSSEVADWVKAENDISRPYLESLPGRENIRKQAETLWNYKSWGVPRKTGGRYFFEVSDGVSNQPVLYYSSAADGAPEIAIDPNGFSEDGTIAMANYVVSPDGRKIAYARSDGGTDWVTLHVRDLDTGKDLPETLRDVKFGGSISWLADSQGFVYNRYPQDENGRGDDTRQARIFYHRIGGPQSADTLVYEVTDHPRRQASGQVSEDGDYLVLSLIEGSFDNGVYYMDLRKPERPVVRLLDQWDGIYDFLGNAGQRFYFRTTADAPNGRVIAIDLDRPGPDQWFEVVAETDTPIYAASLAADHVVLHYLTDAHSTVRLVRLNGTPDGEIPLPGLGTVYGNNANKPSSGDEDRLSSRLGDDQIFFGFTSYVDPASTYEYKISSRTVTPLESAVTPFDGDQYQTRQVFFESKDGTRVPMFLTHRKDLKADGQQPTLLYGYGGFNQALTPGYSPRWAIWLDMGGMLAIPNLRGGGEYGKRWHEAGTRLKKQNVFDDFIAAAEWLIDEGYTSPERLAVFGGSNGGLLVAACMLQRPELFGAVVPAVGVLDMLRYHTATANARFWATDYGLSENEDEFRAQYAYSPLHNVKTDVCYPATLIQTGDHDDRVASWHSFKFGAELQQAQSCANPIIVRVETRGGHGAGKPTWMRIEEEADRFAFVRQALGLNKQN
ncbi:MAG: prolyl oligopeptidase family serine peptidase [Gammaproteobacteria bacterium]